MRSELPENLLAGGRTARKENLVGMCFDGGLRRFGGFGKQRDEFGVETGLNDKIDQRQSGGSATHSRLEQNGIASGERLDHLHARQKQGVVARTND